jgi:hypothetical protein
VSRQELVDEYLAGGVSRRSFVRRLVATGVSMGAALSYAEVLAPEAVAAPRAARRGAPHDAYPLVSTKILTRDIADVRQHNRLKVKVTTNSALVVHMSAFVEKQGRLGLLGIVPYDPLSARTFHGPGTKTLTVEIFGGGGIGKAGPLAGMKQARVFVETSFDQGSSTFSVAKAILK